LSIKPHGLVLIRFISQSRDTCYWESCGLMDCVTAHLAYRLEL
jgi:hypothetical protein